MRIMVAGDSLGFTAAYPPPTRAELPGYIASVDMRAIIGCGLLVAPGYTPVDVDNEGASAFDCSRQAEAERIGLSARPDWMVFFSGGWEHLPWITPDGRTLEARSPQLRSDLVEQLAHRARLAHQAGVRTAFVAWVCPHDVSDKRRGEFARWYNQVLRDAAAQIPGAFVIEPTDRVCVNADAAGEPTPEKRAAFRGHHPEDKRWLWQEWIGPILNGRR
jgi:hypothetical protein